MKWHSLRRSAAGQLSSWLQKNEWRHIALSAKLRETPPGYLGRTSQGRVWVREEGGKITGGIYVSRYGVCLPAFDSPGGDPQEALFVKNLLLPRRNQLFSFMGLSSRVRFLETCLGERPPNAQNYRLLVKEEPYQEEVSPPPGGKMHQAGPEDWKLLWPLERAYLLEEVLSSPEALNEQAAQYYFLQKLKEQKNCYASLNGLPIAKAGTNAQGWHFDQIGGVFTLPEYRGRGWGRFIVGKLLSSLGEPKRGACLFVKEANQAALRLYRGMGFQDQGPFRIAYWSS